MAHRVGLVMLATDHTTEPDFHRIVAPRGIGVYATRIPFANPVTPETLAAMAPDIAAAARLILPDEALDAVVYSCTSASVVIGDDAVRRCDPRGQAGRAGDHADLCRVCGAAGPGCAADHAADALHPRDDAADGGLLREAAASNWRAISCLGLTDDRAMARISPDSVVEAARAAVVPGSEALFIACTAVRAAGVIDRIEAATGVPTVSSNLATAWAALRACGDRQRRRARGADGAGAP